MPYAVYCMGIVHKATLLTCILFLITFNIMMLSASNDGMIMNTAEAGSGCQFKAEARNLTSGTE
jgi:hypothetical protein